MNSEPFSIRTEVVDDEDGGELASCATCGARLSADSRFCESCGTDRATTVWVIEVGVDGSRAETARRAGIDFPHERQPVEVRHQSTRVVIGRRREGSGAGAEAPDLDLSGTLADPGVSHAHAVIERDDGRWTVTDLGSTNGTALNGKDLVPHTPHPVGDGDTLEIGVWTVIRIRVPGA
jgi:RNA polymerase subunit RPABC4/transcription elongation factor Spt4